MKHLIRQSLLGVMLGISTASSFLLFSHLYGAPGITGEAGVPQNGYIYEIIQNKLLINGNLNTTDGKVTNADRLDNIPAAGYQKDITGACPIGEWAVGVDLNNTLHCRAN